MLNKIVRKEIEFAGKKLVLETGKYAGLTNLSLTATYGETVLLVTLVSAGLQPETEFFPLRIDYQERFYASGTVKNSRFQKRDGRSTDEAIIDGRVIDHAVRPLFPQDFMDDVQIVVTILSLDPEVDPRFLSMLAASACLHASDIPWNGPMVTARVGYVNDNYVLNPNNTDLHSNSDLDMTVSFVGADRKFLAVEAEANILPENVILGAIEFARDRVTPLFDFITDFAKEVNPEHKKYEYESQAVPTDVIMAVDDFAGDRIQELMTSLSTKETLMPMQHALQEEVYAKFEGKYKKTILEAAFHEIEKNRMQKYILDTEKRVDGRGIKEVRPISIEVGILPRTHGSALFTRGVTQALTTATLASPSMELLIQDMYGERAKRYLHYYNFPPYANGETGRIGAPKNREIGHGMIAENALRPVIPSQEDFPYMILLVSEVLASSGSSSMAATCGSSLALMDAGVPIKDIVAGVGVGLICDKEFKKSLVMTDLAYMEDAFGMMDFKMTGTKDGVTAIQCDMKLAGVPIDLIPRIIEQSKEGRMHVLEEMKKVISSPRATLSKYAPKTASTKIDPEKIGMVIGTGGKVIKEIQEKTATEVNIEDDGLIVITGLTQEGVDSAKEIIEGMVKEVKAGEIYEGTVEEIVDFGAFVEILPGKTGLLHVSEIADTFVKDVNEHLKVGDKIKVKVLEAGMNGKVSLSIKALTETTERPQKDTRRQFSKRSARI